MIPLQGQRAQEMVREWTWEAVTLQYAALLSRRSSPLPLLGEDPFKDIHLEKSNIASWHRAELRLLSGHFWDFRVNGGPIGFKGSRLYALFVDSDLQVQSFTILPSPLIIKGCVKDSTRILLSDL